MLDFIGLYLKSPIIDEKMPFSGTKLSDFAGANYINKKTSVKEAFFEMVPLIRIGLTTPSLPMTCSTTELQRHKSYSPSNLRVRKYLKFCATITKYIELFKNQSLFL